MIISRLMKNKIILGFNFYEDAKKDKKKKK